MAARLLEAAAPFDLDVAARRLASRARCLIVVDDIDRGGPQAIKLLAVVAARLVAASTAVVATASTPLGLGRELRLGGLSKSELAAVVGEVPAGAAPSVAGVAGPARRCPIAGRSAGGCRRR